jgi:hypothetical protein
MYINKIVGNKGKRWLPIQDKLQTGVHLKKKKWNCGRGTKIVVRVGCGSHFLLQYSRSS